MFAVQLFVLGIFRIVLAFTIPDALPAAKVLSVVLGVLALIVGVVCLRSPQQTVVVLTLVLGGCWLIHGVVDIVAGIGGRGQPMRGWTIVGGGHGTHTDRSASWLIQPARALSEHRTGPRSPHRAGDPPGAARHHARCAEGAVRARNIASRDFRPLRVTPGFGSGPSVAA